MGWSTESSSSNFTSFFILLPGIFIVLKREAEAEPTIVPIFVIAAGGLGGRSF
jgi:hypothetical protein